MDVFLTFTFTEFFVSSRWIFLSVTLACPPFLGRSLNIDMCFLIFFLKYSSHVFDGLLFTILTKRLSSNRSTSSGLSIQIFTNLFLLVSTSFFIPLLLWSTEIANSLAMLLYVAFTSTLPFVASLVAISVYWPQLSRAAVRIFLLSHSQDSRTLTI